MLKKKEVLHCIIVKLMSGWQRKGHYSDLVVESLNYRFNERLWLKKVVWKKRHPIVTSYLHMCRSRYTHALARTHTHTSSNVSQCFYFCVCVVWVYAHLCMVACTQRPEDCRVETSELKLQTFVDSEPCYMGTRMWTPVLMTEQQTFLPSCSPFGQNIRLLFFLPLGYWSFLHSFTYFEN